MHQAIEQTKRTIAVLSERYLASVFAAAEWHAIFAKDPTGQFARGDPEARPEGAAGRMVMGRPPQSRFERTLAVAFGPSRKLEWIGTAGTHLVLMDALRIHHETTTRSLRALSRQTRRSMGVSAEPEGGFEPPTCRLRGHSRPTSEGKTDKLSQVRKAKRQGKNDQGKGGTLAETLVEQSRPSSTLHQFDRPI